MPEEEKQEDGPNEDVEDTVPDHLGRVRDDVTALGATPGDRVCNEQEGEETGAANVRGAKDAAAGECSTGTVEEEHNPIKKVSVCKKRLPHRRHLPDVDECSATEGEVTPLVGAVRKSADETHDDHDPGHEYSAQDIGDREATGEQHLQHEEREGDEPLNVADILRREQ